MINSEIILEILAFGTKGLANAGLKDLYESWKQRIKEKLASTTIGKYVEPTKMLEDYERDPNALKRLMKDALDEAQVEKDPEIIMGATKFLALLKPKMNNVTFQNFNNTGSGTQNNIGNRVVNNHTVYSQASPYFDEIDERNGFRVRKSYRRNPVTGACTIVGQQLA